MREREREREREDRNIGILADMIHHFPPLFTLLSIQGGGSIIKAYGGYKQAMQAAYPDKNLDISKFSMC